jgi:hypothetical protein
VRNAGVLLKYLPSADDRALLVQQGSIDLAYGLPAGKLDSLRGASGERRPAALGPLRQQRRLPVTPAGATTDTTGPQSPRASFSISDDRRTVPGRVAGQRSFAAIRSNPGPLRRPAGPGRSSRSLSAMAPPVPALERVRSHMLIRRRRPGQAQQRTQRAHDLAAAAGTQHRTGPAPPPDLRRQAIRDQRNDQAGSARTRRAAPHGRARCRGAGPAPCSVRICHGVRPCREGAASPGGATLAGGWRNRLLTRRKANALPLSGAP